MAGHDHQQHYIKIYVVLLVLFLISVAGPEIGIQWVTLVTAFGIAFVKAYLVIVHFMHINVEKKYITYLMATSLLFMGLFWAGVAPDVMRHEGQNWTNDGAKKEVSQRMAEIEARKAAGGHDAHGKKAAH